MTEPKKLSPVLIAVAVLVVAAVAWFVVNKAAGGSSDSYYDKSMENPKLPPGVKPGEQVPPPDK